ncbi:MAG: 50S ribosome-binding GTPase, partial [Acidobacteria bacterium]|nr:50S ribosome-binding GTPase [Acidobacteriota bacterium]
EERLLALELKMMADVGLVGFPNAGKSTLVRAVSAARPKVADYPFTTLEPSLGVVQADSFDGFVMADIPGIIEGASDGAGLGLRFIKHIERTGILLFLIDPLDPTTPVADAYRILDGELVKFNPRLARKKRFVAFTKCDLVWGEVADAVRTLSTELTSNGIEVFEISAMKKINTARLVQRLFEGVKAERGTWHLPEIEEPVPTPKMSSDPLDELS